MDIHIPLIFVYGSFFLLSFYMLAKGMKSYQLGQEKWWSPWAMLTGVLTYVAGAVYVAEYVTFFTLIQSAFLFVVAALALFIAFFFKGQKWLFYLYSLVVVVTTLGLYFQFLPF